PRELAEQAFALLQEALRESEKRAAELEEQLGQRVEPPEGSPESALLELQRRLETAEAERDRFKADAARLEEVLAEERVKAEQLKAKLDVAESGPDKLTKKEINFWRSKVDDFDRSISEHKARIAELRRELQARDEQLDALAARERELTETSDASARRISELETENAGLGTRIDELGTRVEEQAARIAELE